MLSCLVFGPSSVADVWSDARGIITDPFKLKASSENALQGVDELGALLEEAISGAGQLRSDIKRDVTEILNDIGEIVDRVDLTVKSSIDQAKRDVLEVTKSVHEKSVDVVREAECAAINTVDEAINSAFGRSGPIKFVAGSRTLTLPFKERRCTLLLFCKTDEVTFKIRSSWTPRQKYQRIRDRLIKNVNTGVEPVSSTENLVGTYADISRFAKLAQCAYRGDPYALTLSKERAFWNRKVLNWQNSVYR